MDNTIRDKIQSYFKGQRTIPKNKLVECILKDFPELKESSINVYLSRLKKEGLLKNPARGLYAMKGKEEFCPIVDVRLKRLFNKIKKDYPFIEFCIWNTKWLNELMRHQPFKFYTILELEKDVTESVFYSLKEQGKQVFLDPDAETFELYIHNSDDVIILKQLISEAPLQEVENIVIPSLEKLLVDMIIDTKVYAAQQGELDFIYTSAFEKFEVNKSRMKRYAYRRNREKEIENITNLTLAKIQIFAKT
ncbi:DUF6577 family protein [Allomuricauda sp. R78024]|uniref:DUF6577 family protein n=1 Tax=Allomuricauda sp. R78024 TaxID=3093867 RepID=UPI0037C7526C